MATESELTGDGLRDIRERDAMWRPEPDGSWTYLERGAFTELMHVHCEQAIADRRALLAALPNREAAPREGLDAVRYVERFADGSTFDWFAQLRRTLAAYERNRQPGNPFAGDIDLAEALSAAHALDRLGR